MVTMSDVHGSKLNRLQREVPEGFLVDAAWLERNGYASNLRHRYVSSGWLESLAHGIYRRPPPRLRATTPQEIPWAVALVSLQTLMAWPGVVGGRTALTAQGFGHYLQPHGADEVHLYGNQPPPGWLRKLPTGTQYIFHRAGRLFDPNLIAEEPHAVRVDVASGVTTPLPRGLRSHSPDVAWSATGWPIICSAPERAILELLDELPERETFQQVDVIFQSLVNLHPRQCQRLLEACHNVKVKRLFLWFVQRHHSRLLSQLDRARIDLGKGKRLIARNGRWNREFQITVPGDLDGTG